MKPPSGYFLPNQPYSKFGYDGNSYLPALLGKGRGLLPGVARVISFAKFFSLGSGYFAQPEFGMTQGGTMFPTAGNTSATVLTLSGPTPTLPKAITVKALNSANVGSGALFNVYNDGGTNPFLSGVPLSALTPVGQGQNIQASVASSVTGNTWNATCSQLLDQSGNGFHWTQITPANQPIVTPGFNGHIGLKFDGLASFIHSTFITTPPSQLWMVYRYLSVPFNDTVIGSGTVSNANSVQHRIGVPNTSIYNGAFLDGGVIPQGSVGRLLAVYNNLTSQIKAGSNPLVNGTDGGVGFNGGRGVGCDRWNNTPIGFSNIEVFAWGEMPIQPITSADNQANGYWGTVLI